MGVLIQLAKDKISRKTILAIFYLPQDGAAHSALFILFKEKVFFVFFFVNLNYLTV